MYYLTKEQTGSFEYYGKWVGEQFLYVVYDPDTEYYFRKFINYTVVSDESFDDELAKIIDGLDFKYGEAFGKALKKYVTGISVYKQLEPGTFGGSGPTKYINQIPALNQNVKHPVDGTMSRLQDVIISLNDSFKWSREKIAEWCDNIHDPTGVNGPNLNLNGGTNVSS